MLTSIISSQSSTRRSSSGEMGITPALLTSTSSFPYRSHASLTRADRSLLVGHMLPACSLLAPCDPGASTPRTAHLLPDRPLGRQRRSLRHDDPRVFRRIPVLLRGELGVEVLAH